MDLLGYKRYAEYVGEGLEVLGTYKDKPLIVKKQLGEGAVICMGSLFAAEFDLAFEVSVEASDQVKQS